jgi:hypothetical protein
MKGAIQRNKSSRWIHVIPSAQMIQTVVQMIMTPAHCGKLPSETAQRQDAPLRAFIAFHPQKK